MAKIEGKSVVAFVPWKRREALRGLAAKADLLYLGMCRDAGFHGRGKLPLLFGDWTDGHNGYSFVVPFPLVEVDLALPRTPSTIFDGYRPLERTLVHEFAHQISNDRNYGFRKQLESIFGRVVPADPLSLLVWFFSTPAHPTMPRFWQEGLAIWAETAYADPGSPWAGRGRDPLVHMVWRLDAAAGRIPRARDWRITWHLWPFGNRAYLYGAAYTRYLAALLGTRKKMWKLVDLQARQFPFSFDEAPLPLLGATHGELISRAREALMKEEEANLRILRKVPPTHLDRLTPPHTLLGAPAWLPGGKLAYMARPLHGRPRLHVLHPDGRIQVLGETGHELGNLRSPSPGLLVWAEYDWRRISWIHLGGWVLGRRLVQPDYLPGRQSPGLLAAIRFTETGGTRLVLLRVDRSKRRVLERRVLPARDLPWTPAFRPSRGERPAQIAWVETFRGGSRLVLASLSHPERRKVLLRRRGRILHPVWAPGGKELFFCSDSTGVADAWRLSLGAGDRVAALVPVTHTLGGVVACVPSPDGKTLALVDHDERGPFLAKVPCDPSLWPRKLPVIRPIWPAPIPPGRPQGGKPSRREPLPRRKGKIDLGPYRPEPYRGLTEFRPLFWTPTTLPVPEGGIGISGMGADPLLTHLAMTSAGVGPVEHQAVGYLGYAYLGSPIEIGGSLWRSERTYQDQVKDAAGNDYDYTETADTMEIRAGRGLAGLERTFLGYLGLGIEGHHRVSRAARAYRGRPLVSSPPFRGTERYVQATLGYGDAAFFPQSYAPGDGITATLEFRHSGLGGSLRRNRLFLNATWALDLPGKGGVQFVLGGQAGWSDGDRTLQGNFVVGGPLGRGLPRGYSRDTEAVGRHLLAGSAACRVPLWRPFRGFSTTPFRFRQLVLEVFGDSAKVSTDKFAGNGRWYSSLGGELHAGWEFRTLLLSPGLGLAKQLDGDRSWQAWVTMGFRF